MEAWWQGSSAWTIGDVEMMEEELVALDELIYGRTIRAQTRAFIKDHWGERCDEFDSDCGCCKAWQAFDLIFRYVEND